MMQAQMPKENEVKRALQEIDGKLRSLNENSGIEIWLRLDKDFKGIDYVQAASLDRGKPIYEVYGNFRGVLVNTYLKANEIGINSYKDEPMDQFFVRLKSTLMKRVYGETLNDEEKKLSEAFDSAVSKEKLIVTVARSVTDNNSLLISAYPRPEKNKSGEVIIEKSKREEDKGKLVPVPVTKETPITDQELRRRVLDGTAEDPDYNPRY